MSGIIDFAFTLVATSVCFAVVVSAMVGFVAVRLWLAEREPDARR